MGMYSTKGPSLRRALTRTRALDPQLMGHSKMPSSSLVWYTCRHQGLVIQQKRMRILVQVEGSCSLLFGFMTLFGNHALLQAVKLRLMGQMKMTSASLVWCICKQPAQLAVHCCTGTMSCSAPAVGSCLQLCCCAVARV